MSGNQDQDSPGDHRPAAWTYRAVVEEYEGKRDQCTIFPRESTGIDRMATWVTAQEGSFVRLDEMR